MSDYEYHRDFSCYNGEDTLQGLTPFGFKGNEPLCVANFDQAQLEWAHDFAMACFPPIKSINTKHTSYGLKHIAERRAKILSDNEVNYITNGALILAMVDAGFEFRRKPGSPNVMFNVSERAIKLMAKHYNR